MNQGNTLEKLEEYLDERVGLDEVRHVMEHKTVPVHKHSFWYYWGGITLVCFIIQLLTGILLLVYYRPGDQAYESVRHITFEINFGWLIRSAHSWSATLFLASAFIHMFSVYFMKAYRRPRELGWWSGMALLGLGTVFGFSGYLLPMDDLAFFATKVGLSMADMLPVLGPVIGNLMRGGLEVNAETVQRMFALHVVVLPLLFLPLLGFHLFLVQKHGNALPESEEKVPVAERKAIPFFPNFLMKDLAMWLVTLNVLALLASCFPQQLGPQADPLGSAPPGIHPEWYFMAPFQLLKIFGKIPGPAGEALGMGSFTLGMILWTLIPFYDVKTESGKRGKNATYFGIGILTILVVTTIWGYAAL